MPSVTYSFAASTVARSSQVNQNFSDVCAAIRPTFVFTVIGTLTTGTNQTPVLIVPSSLTIEKAYALVKTAPTGADLIIDINVGGTSIWNVTQANRLTISAGDTTGTQTSFDTTSLSENDQLTLDLDQIGSTVGGESLTVELKCS